jgi:hypothetical protein
MKNRTKIDTTWRKPHTTPPNQDETTSNQRRREGAMSAMGRANTRHSNKNEEVNPLEELRHTAPTTSIETTSSPTRHKVTMHSAQRAFGAAVLTSNYSTKPCRPPNTTFRDRHPDVPPLLLDPQRRTTQSPEPKLHRAKCS